MPTAGAILGSFTLERLVGSGGMSQVWCARDTRSDERVALKLLSPREASADSLSERLTREARAAHAIAHRAIVPVRDVFEHEGSPVLVMELLEGETARQLLMREARLPVPRVAAMLLPVAEALVAAHDAGVVHRDLKPENIFLQLQGTGESGSIRVRLLDFGVARFYDAPGGSGLHPITGLEVLLGTLCYMAPEQALHPAECDQRVDVWAFGVTLYEMLAGCRPIEGETPQDTLRQLLLGGIVPIEVLLPELSDDMVTLVSSLLVRKVDARASTLASAVAVLGAHATQT